MLSEGISHDSKPVAAESTGRGEWLTRARHLSRRLFVPFVVALPILLATPFLSEPFDRDEGAYAVVARGVLEGQLPYRDVFDHKPPIIYGWYALSFVVFGDHVVSPRIMAGLASSGTALLVLTAGTLLVSRRYARRAALAFACSSGFVLLSADANTEIFMLLPLTAAFAAATAAIQRGEKRWFLLAGACSALAVLTKPVAVVPSAALALAILLWAADGKRGLALFVAAGVLAALPVAAPFAVAGALDHLFYANVRYNQLYQENLILLSYLGGLSFLLIATAPLLLLALDGLSVLIRRAPKTVNEKLLLLWAAASLASTLVTGRAFGHYWVGLLPAMALLAGVALDVGVGSWLRTHSTRRVQALLLGPAVVWVLFSLGANARAYIQPTPAERHAAKMGDPQDAVTLIVAEKVAKLSAPGEQIYEFGRDSALYFYADRDPAARFIYDLPFWLDPATLDEATKDLRRDPPELFVVTTGMNQENLPGLTSELNGKPLPPRIVSMLKQNYELVSSVAYADLYRLNEPPADYAREAKP